MKSGGGFMNDWVARVKEEEKRDNRGAFVAAGVITLIAALLVFGVTYYV